MFLTALVDTSTAEIRAFLLFSHCGGVGWEKPGAGRIQLVSGITVLTYRVEESEILTCCTNNGKAVSSKD